MFILLKSELDLKLKATLKPESWIYHFVALCLRAVVKGRGFSPVNCMALPVVAWAASRIVACGAGHCTRRTGIEVYYWPPRQALLTKLIPWNKYNVENHIYA